MKHGVETGQIRRWVYSTLELGAGDSKGSGLQLAPLDLPKRPGRGARCTSGGCAAFGPPWTRVCRRWRAWEMVLGWRSA